MYINGPFLTVTLTHFGLNHWTLSWMIIKYLHSYPTIVFLWPHQWDFSLKFPILKTQVQLPYLEVVYCSSMKQILDGARSLTVGSTDLNPTWRQLKIHCPFNILQSMKLPKLCSSVASKVISKPHLICTIKLKLHILLLHQLWDSFTLFAWSLMAYLLNKTKQFKVYMAQRKSKKNKKLYTKLSSYSLQCGLTVAASEEAKTTTRFSTNSMEFSVLSSR